MRVDEPFLAPGAPPPGGRFNLSEWALRHRSLVLYLIVVCAIFGLTRCAYIALERSMSSFRRA